MPRKAVISARLRGNEGEALDPVQLMLIGKQDVAWSVGWKRYFMIL